MSIAELDRLVRESRTLLHTLEHLYNRKGYRYARAFGMAEQRHLRRRARSESCAWCGKWTPWQWRNTVPWPDDANARMVCDRCCDEEGA